MFIFKKKKEPRNFVIICVAYTNIVSIIFEMVSYDKANILRI